MFGLVNLTTQVAEDYQMTVGHVNTPQFRFMINVQKTGFSVKYSANCLLPKMGCLPYFGLVLGH